MKLVNINKILGVCTIALVMAGCGGGSSSGDKVNTLPMESNVYIGKKTPYLMWQDDIYVEVITKPWLEQANYDACTNNLPSSSVCTDTSGDTAATYCHNMTLNGYADWRLPFEGELRYFYIYDQDAEVEYILYDHSYWTSSQYNELAANIVGQYGECKSNCVNSKS